MKITCPKCGYVTEMTESELSAVNHTIVCPQCMSQLKVDGDYAYIPTDSQTFDPQPEPAAAPQPSGPCGDGNVGWVAADGVDDPLLADAIEYIKMCNAISVPMLQRYLQISADRAAQLMKQLEQKGIVGPYTGGPRTILIPHSSDPFGPTPRNRAETQMLKDMRQRIGSGDAKTRVFNCSGCSIALFVLLLILIVAQFCSH